MAQGQSREASHPPLPHELNGRRNSFFSLKIAGFLQLFPSPNFWTNRAMIFLGKIPVKIPTNKL